VGVIDDDFTFVAASASRAARTQRDACQVIVDDPTTRRGLALATHLKRAYDAIDNRVEDRTDKFEAAHDDSVKEDAIVEMRRFVWEVRGLQSNFAWLDAAQNPPLDLGTTYYVEDVARSLVSDNVEVTIVATEDDLSYATNSNPYDPVIEAWGTEDSNEGPGVVVVFIPRRERRSGLLHPLIVHELGHAADDAHGLVDELWSLAQERSRLSKRFAAAAKELADERSIEPSQAIDLIAEILRSWTTECLCDCIAVHHLGPTYLYSFIAEVVAGSLDEAAPRHPPPRQRIRYLLGYLDRLGWRNSMHAEHPAIVDWIDEVAALQPPYSSPWDFLTWSIEELGALVRRRTERLMRKRVFRPEPEEMDEAKRLLAIGVPPSQRRCKETILPATVMLACWDAALADPAGTVETLATAPDSQELAEVLPAALEQSALTRAWPT
jgi:hypothetical protein